MELAKKDRVPPYLVFTDKTLTQMCQLHPKTKEEMLMVSGVGENKFRKYGEAFLALTQRRKAGLRNVISKSGRRSQKERNAGSHNPSAFYMHHRTVQMSSCPPHYLLPDRCGHLCPFHSKYQLQRTAHIEKRRIMPSFCLTGLLWFHTSNDVIISCIPQSQSSAHQRRYDHFIIVICRKSLLHNFNAVGRCVVTMHVLGSESSIIFFKTCFSVSMSSAEVASSRSSTGAFLSSALAMERRCACPS